MASFVLFVDGLAGTTQRALAIAAQLQGRGHAVVVSSPADLSDDAERADVPFVHLARTDERQAIRSALDRPGRDDVRPTTLLRWALTGLRLRARSLGDREIEDVLSAHRPDLVLVDHEFRAAGLACRAAGQRFVLVTGLFSTVRSHGNPPLGGPLDPATASPTEIEAAWERAIDGHRSLKRSADRLRSRIVARFRPVQLMTSNTVDLAAFARSRGLRLDDEVTREHWVRPFSIDHVDTISFTPSALEWAPSNPRWHTVGIVSPTTPMDRSSDEDRARLADLWERRRRDPGRPLVYAALGTFWKRAAGTIGVLVDALGRLDGVDAVVGLGSLVDPADLSPRSNVTLLGWAPQAELVEYADLAVIHGGVTSIGECLLAGTPAVMMSTHTNDQDGNVARAVAAGLGVAVDHRSIDAIALSEAIDRALHDEGLRARAREVAREVREESDRELGARLLERMAEATTDRSG